MKHKFCLVLLLILIFVSNGDAFFFDKIKKKIENELEPMELPLF